LDYTWKHFTFTLKPLFCQEANELSTDSFSSEEDWMSLRRQIQRYRRLASLEFNFSFLCSKEIKM
jgi:hypothetical protein